MIKKSITWITLIIISIGCFYLAYKLFPRMHPFLNVKVTMNRSEALNAGRQFAQQHGLGPEDFRQAVTFVTDTAIRNYIELEAGGIDEYQKLLQKLWYSPYAWQVRHFKEDEMHDLLIHFRPDGKLLGFREKLNAGVLINNLDRNSALLTAKRSVQVYQPIDFDNYVLVDESAITNAAGRLDYTFVFQRSAYTIGKAQYQLKLVISGNMLTEVTPYFKIPDSFRHRYKLMQNSNNAIFYLSAAAAGILYFLGGCVIGLIILIKRRQLFWQIPLLLASLLGILIGWDLMNNGMSLWMTYDPSISEGKFMFLTVSRFLIRFVAFVPLLAICFASAEGLTRMAFPDQISLWRIWSKEAAGSSTVFGYTAGAFLGVSIYFAVYLSLSFIGTRICGWWIPSEIEPEVLASSFPWFSAIVTGLQTGLLEECFFRAIPIAGAALIGQKLGCRRAAIGIALVLQTIIFCGVHANYLQHPAYARLVVELIVPTFLLGVIYLKYGLLPVIILHGCVNVIWGLVPLVPLSTAGACKDIVIAIFIALIPLWIVLFARTRTGKRNLIKAKYIYRR